MNGLVNFRLYYFGDGERSRVIGSRQQFPELLPDHVADCISNARKEASASIEASQRGGSDVGQLLVVGGSCLEGPLDVCGLRHECLDGHRWVSHKAPEDAFLYSLHEDLELLHFLRLWIQVVK